MGASNMTRPGADLLAWYLNPDRLPVEGRWSRKHADSQRRLDRHGAARIVRRVTRRAGIAKHVGPHTLMRSLRVSCR
jgi:hypothetical protein